MSDYEIILTRDTVESTTLIIQASDPTTATGAALNVSTDPDLIWKMDRAPGLRVTAITEVPEFRTRADLFKRYAWQDLLGDDAGNPLVWLNSYQNGEDHWTQLWSCQCDDDGYEPYQSEWFGPEDAAERALWEILPEAGA